MSVGRPTAWRSSWSASGLAARRSGGRASSRSARRGACWAAGDRWSWVCAHTAAPEVLRQKSRSRDRDFLRVMWASRGLGVSRDAHAGLEASRCHVQRDRGPLARVLVGCWQFVLFELELARFFKCGVFALRDRRVARAGEERFVGRGDARPPRTRPPGISGRSMLIVSSTLLAVPLRARDVLSSETLISCALPGSISLLAIVRRAASPPVAPAACARNAALEQAFGEEICACARGDEEHGPRDRDQPSPACGLNRLIIRSVIRPAAGHGVPALRVPGLSAGPASWGVSERHAFAALERGDALRVREDERRRRHARRMCASVSVSRSSSSGVEHALRSRGRPARSSATLPGRFAEALVLLRTDPRVASIEDL